jgi:rhamnosyltransferase subunit A
VNAVALVRFEPSQCANLAVEVCRELYLQERLLLYLQLVRRGHSIQPSPSFQRGANLVKSETGVITIFGKYSVHFEFRAKEGANKTAIMVNGALATTTSFSQSIRNLKDHVNIVLFDLPFAGRSRMHNTNSSDVVSKDDEIEILLYLIEYFKVNYMVSASWGGVSSLLSLAKRPATIEKAVILSFSPVINDAMHTYMIKARRFLCDRDISGGAHLLNSTVGKYLPRLLKVHNHKYLLAMVQGNEQQIMFHIDQIFELDQRNYIDDFAAINVPVLFVNGSLDEYTTIEGVRSLAKHIKHSQFAVIPGAGHFLDLESSQARRVAGEIVRSFLFGRDVMVESMRASNRSDADFVQLS